MPATRRTAQAFVLALATLAPTARSGLVLHWKLDDGTGSATAADASGNNHHGTLTGMDPATDWVNAGLAPVPAGTTYAVDFDGTDDRIVAIGDAYKGVTGTSPRTLAAWIRTTDQNGAIMNWGADSAGQRISFRTQTANGTAGAIRLEVNGGYQVGNTVVSDGTWHHVVAVLRSSSSLNVNQCVLYVDGEIEGISATQGQTVNTASSQNFRVGTDHGSQYFLGLIDDVRLYNHALGRTAIRALAGQPADAYVDAVAADAPVAHWRLGEDTGTRAFHEGTLGPAADGTYTAMEAADYAKPGLPAAGDNTCMEFSGDNDYVAVANVAGVNDGGPFAERVIESWFRTDAFPAGTNRRVILDVGGSTHGINQYILLDTGVYYFYAGAWHNNTPHFPTRVAVTAEQTYHAVSAYNAATDRFIVYLNGAPVSAETGTVMDDLPSATSANAIGAKNADTRFDSGASSGEGQYFAGRIDEVALYNAVLPFRRIQTHYAAGSGARLGLPPTVTLGAALNYDAGLDADADTSFEDTIGTRNNSADLNQFDWNLSGMTAPARTRVSGGSLAKVEYAYRFDGDDTATMQALEYVAGDPSQQDVAFEIVFNPDDFTGNEVLLEFGGTTYGTSFTLNGEVLHFDVKSSAASAGASFDMMTLGAVERAGFIHIVGVASLSADQALLYVNGVLRHTAAGTGDLTDWSGPDGSGLGCVSGVINFGAPAGFDGDIALVRFYPEPLNATEVMNNYMALTAMGSVFMIR